MGVANAAQYRSLNEPTALAQIIHNPQRQQGRLSLNLISKMVITLAFRHPFAVESTVLADAAGYDSKRPVFRCYDVSLFAISVYFMFAQTHE